MICHVISVPCRCSQYTNVCLSDIQLGCAVSRHVLSTVYSHPAAYRTETFKAFVILLVRCCAVLITTTIPELFVGFTLCPCVTQLYKNVFYNVPRQIALSSRVDYFVAPPS